MGTPVFVLDSNYAAEMPTRIGSHFYSSSLQSYGELFVVTLDGKRGRIRLPGCVELYAAIPPHAWPQGKLPSQELYNSFHNQVHSYLLSICKNSSQERAMESAALYTVRKRGYFSYSPEQWMLQIHLPQEYMVKRLLCMLDEKPLVVVEDSCNLRLPLEIYHSTRTTVQLHTEYHMARTGSWSYVRDMEDESMLQNTYLDFDWKVKSVDDVKEVEYVAMLAGQGAHFDCPPQELLAGYMPLLETYPPQTLPNVPADQIMVAAMDIESNGIDFQGGMIGTIAVHLTTLTGKAVETVVFCSGVAIMTPHKGELEQWKERWGTDLIIKDGLGEKFMLESFSVYLRSHTFVVWGYNSTNFDWPFVYHRMNALGCEDPRQSMAGYRSDCHCYLSPVVGRAVTYEQQLPSVPGLILLDAFNYASRLDTANNRLNTVAGFLGLGNKKDTTASFVIETLNNMQYSRDVCTENMDSSSVLSTSLSPRHMWAIRLGTVAVYNAWDVGLTAAVAHKMGSFYEALGLGKKSNAPMHMVARQANSHIHAYNYLTLAAEKGGVLNCPPRIQNVHHKDNTHSRTHGEGHMTDGGSEEHPGEHKFKGATILEGVRAWLRYIATLDFTSLYPSIMFILSISPDVVYLQNGKSVQPHAGWYKWREVATVDHNNNPAETYYFITHVNVHTAQEPQWERYEGIWAPALRNMSAERKHVKKEMKKYDRDSVTYNVLSGQQGTIKILMNSLFGSLAAVFFDFRMSCISVCICAVGRSLLELAIRTAKQHSLSVVYGDTDSIMVHVRSTLWRKYWSEAKTHLPCADHIRHAKLEYFGNSLQRELFCRRKVYCIKKVCEQVCADIEAQCGINMKDEGVKVLALFLQKKRYLTLTLEDPWGEFTESISGCKAKRTDGFAADLYRRLGFLFLQYGFRKMEWKRQTTANVDTTCLDEHAYGGTVQNNVQNDPETGGSSAYLTREIETDDEEPEIEKDSGAAVAEKEKESKRTSMPLDEPWTMEEYLEHPAYKELDGYMQAIVLQTLPLSTYVYKVKFNPNTDYSQQNTPAGRVYTRMRSSNHPETPQAGDWISYVVARNQQTTGMSKRGQAQKVSKKGKLHREPTLGVGDFALPACDASLKDVDGVHYLNRLVEGCISEYLAGLAPAAVLRCLEQRKRYYIQTLNHRYKRQTELVWGKNNALHLSRV
jgi:DNA polymerase elongation subunit (family B)